MNANEFVNLVSKLNTDKKSYTLGTIDPAYNGVGLPKVVVDGETLPSLKGYSFLESYSPKAGERVLLSNIGGSHVILGGITLDGFNDTRVNVTPPTGWSNYNTTYESLGYSRRGGIVFIHGMLNPPITSGGVTLFTLPVGYRPAKNILVPAIGYDGAFKSLQLNIQSNGAVHIATTLVTDFSWISIGGWSFPAEA